MRYLAFAFLPYLFVISGKSLYHPISCCMLFWNENLRNSTKQTHYCLIIFPEIFCNLWVSLEKETSHHSREIGNQHSWFQPLRNTRDILMLSNLLSINLNNLTL